MEVHLTRDSVANGDDAYPKELIINDDAGLVEILRVVSRSNFLASIGGGKATWTVISRIPIAVVAQQWVEPKMLMPVPSLSSLNFLGNALSLHFDYCVQQDPDLVYEEFQRVHSRRSYR